MNNELKELYKENPLRWQIEMQTNYMHRIANRIKKTDVITAEDLVDLAVSCQVLLLELRERGVDV